MKRNYHYKVVSIADRCSLHAASNLGKQRVGALAWWTYFTLARFCRCAYFAKFNFGTLIKGPSG